ncbi:hypothetical protein QFC20_004770 [Naganishia adeliensis]|uniref:Uncharacterized protein n=1 Tax=Naganishia adeliensis TaxID=92952 RepID=A0ACC2VVY8_9TREE|nr:hypothetical protein QFC20_004770 [Naganishia adeliensis]
MSDRTITPPGGERLHTPSRTPSPHRRETPLRTPEPAGTVATPVPTRFLEGYDEPSANVVLVGSDGVGLKVHDCYLKAASPFFLEMLEAGTKGGPVPLQADSLQLGFIMDRVCGKVPRWDTLKALAMTAPRPVILDGRHAIWALSKLDEIAKKYLLIGMSEYVQQLIINYAGQNPPPPAVLLHACQSSPIHGRMASAASEAFQNEMPIWMNEYFEKSTYAPRHDPAKRHFFIPEATNLRQSFVEALGVRVFFAYSRALKEGSLYLRNVADTDFVKPMGFDWNNVAKVFMATMTIPQRLRSWPLQHEDDDARSTWSTSSVEIAPHFSPSDRGLTPPIRRRASDTSSEMEEALVE